MWNDPESFDERGRQFELSDLAVLLLGVDTMLDTLTFREVTDVVEEHNLRLLEKSEIIFTVYEVLQAMLEDIPVPEGGHTGIQEAMVAELLWQSLGMVSSEVELGGFEEFGETGDSSRRVAWHSIDRLLINGGYSGGGEPWWPLILEDAGITPADPQPWLSDKLTVSIWEELLTGEDYLLSAFLHDTDWRMECLLDAPPDQAEAIAMLTGQDMKVVHGLPKTPTPDEVEKAERYIRDVVRKGDSIHFS